MVSHLNNTQVSSPFDSGGKDVFERSRARNQLSTSVRPDIDFKKPRRFPERDSYTRIPLSVNRSKLSIPYKSELCMLFKRGKCYYGENCHFAHRASDIRQQPAGVNALPVEGQLNLRECRYFASGIDCPYGNNCQYLHKCGQKVRRDKVLYWENDAVAAVDGVLIRNAGEDNDKSVYLKTRICAKWERFGSCPYGVKCTYAHGKAELRKRGSPAKIRYGNTSESTQLDNATSCEARIKIAKKLKLKGKKCFLNWDIDKASQIYADWMDVRPNFHVSFS